jgi:hypothetical protein
MYLNLYPDMSRKAYEANDTFIFAAPIPPPTWEWLRAKATRKTGDDVEYLLPKDLPGMEDVVIIFRQARHSDEDMLTAAAHIRVVEQCTNRVYCCRGISLTQSQIIARAMGSTD